MADILVPWIENAAGKSLDDLVHALKDKGATHNIEVINWDEFSYKPETKFWIGCSHSELILHYEVAEDRVRAEFGKTGDPVYRDSCVEFFINPGDDSYFNFETNAVGTRYAARGHNREDTIPFSMAINELVRRKASLGLKPFGEREGDVSWSLTLGIPLKFFAGTELADPFGKSFKGNFYKCGDDSKVPHYVTWNPIGTIQPDFHRPEYFGTITFANKA